MFLRTAILFVLGVASVIAKPTTSYVNWKTFKGTGLNLGGWLAQEAVIDPIWWAKYSGGANDEWGMCANLGARCGPVLERRYATYITKSDIDKYAAAGITILRIPTTYAAWVKVPGSQFYSGNQVSFLKHIATYAITKHNMHVIVDVHSLPGGINGLGIGEADGHFGWFNNQTALTYSYKAIEAVITYVQNSGFPQSYTIEPINEPVDNTNFSEFGTPAALSANGTAWTLTYIKGVISRVAAANPKIPVMFHDCFKGEAFWSPSFLATTNLVFDVHNYYFAGRPTNSNNVTADICSDAKASAGDGKFPVFIGEWSIQTVADNKFVNRRKNLNTGLYAFGRYEQGSAYWTGRFFGNVPVEGEGVQGDYWNYSAFIDMGFIDPASGAAYCT